MSPSIPNFFLVGAPKCGTTALYTYLRQHPDVFMTKLKEPNFFCSDVNIPSVVTTYDDYISLFSGGDSKTRVGEASVWYLYSKYAAFRIKDFNPRSLIIIMLRHPVDMLYSLHSQRLYSGVEAITNFQAALDEMSRPPKRSARLLTAADPPAAPFGLDVGRYTAQVRRYLDVFGREQVKIILYDDLRREAPAVYRDVLEYLGVEPDFRPPFEIVNSNKHVRSVLLHRMVRAPSAPLRVAARALVPRTLRPWVADNIVALNSKHAARPPMPADLRQRLTRELAPDIESLGQLLKRDLSHWLRA